MTLWWDGRNDSDMWEDATTPQTAMTGEMVPEQLPVRTLLGSMNEEILEIAEQVYQGQYEAALSVLPTSARSNSWWTSMRTWASTWQGLLYEKPQEQANPCPGGDALMPTPHPKQGHPWRRAGKRRFPSGWGVTLMMSSWHCSRHSRSSTQQHQSRSFGHQQPSKAPPQGSTWRPPGVSHFPLAHHAQSSPMSDYTAVWADFTCSLSGRNLQERGLADAARQCSGAYHRMPLFPTRISHRVFAPRYHMKTGLVWPYRKPWQHTAITHWFGKLLGRRCHWQADAHLPP